MLRKTSGLEFQKYGTTYKESMSQTNKEYVCKEITMSTKTISHLFCFDCEVYIEVMEGIGAILIGETADTNNLDLFAIHYSLKIHANTCFHFIPLSQEVTCFLIVPEDYNLKTLFLNSAYVYRPIIPRLTVKELIGHYYVIKSPHYYFKGEKHNYYELTYVDHGSLSTVVEDQEFILNNYDLMIYGPRQFHDQQIKADTACSYLTLIFSLDIDDDSKLLNKVFHCDNQLYQTLKKFMTENTDSTPYANSLMLCHLQEIIILLLRYSSDNKEQPAITNNSYQYFQDELFQDIINFMDSNVTEPLTIEEICTKFNISRSSLQTLFKKNLDISPKNYMVNLKLKKSKELIHENKFTISEIAYMLGFSSIHYFSRTFKQHFDITPSEFAKKIYDQSNHT